MQDENTPEQEAPQEPVGETTAPEQASEEAEAVAKESTTGQEPASSLGDA